MTTSADPGDHSPDLPTAGFVSRALALTIDAVIIGLSVAVAAFIVSMTWSLVFLRIDPRLDEPVVALASAIAGTLFAIGYHAVCWHLTGRTPGKAMLGIQVVGHDGRLLSFPRSIARFLCYWLSALPLGLGFLWVVGDRKRRAWHDIIVGSRVVLLPSRSSGNVLRVMTEFEDRIVVRKDVMDITAASATPEDVSPG